MKAGIFGSAAAFAALAGCGGGEEGPAGGDAAAGGPDITITSEDGEARISAGDAAGPLPGGLPGYPGAEGGGGIDVNADGRDGGAGRIVSFRTSDPATRVIAFYREAAQARGYTIVAEMDLGQTQSMTAEAPGGDGGLQVSATDMAGTTNVTIIASRS